MRQKIKSFTIVAFALGLVCLCAIPSSAQLTDEMENMFEQIIDELDDDLQQKFNQAMKENRNTIRFTPDEFRRFRDNPVNPFDGIQDIDPDELDGDIELKFELPSLRNRELRVFERQQPSTLATFDPVVQQIRNSVVEVWQGGEQVALGCAVKNDGTILTKASELNQNKAIQVILADRTQYTAKLTRIDKTNDLALIQIRRSLEPITFENSQPLTGTFLVTPGITQSAIGLGTYSSTPRALAGQKQGFLGVKPQTVASGVLLVEVTPNEAGEQAGLRNGDIVTTLAGQAMKDVTDLVNEIRNHSPGDEVEIEFLRNGIRQQTTASLADRNFSGARAARFKMMNRLGAIPSDRNDKFPWVFQHDTPLFPEQCGGPILDIDGRVVGINIARGGRAASYAIPASHLNKILPDLLRADVASRN